MWINQMIAKAPSTKVRAIVRAGKRVAKAPTAPLDRQAIDSPRLGRSAAKICKAFPLPTRCSANRAPRHREGPVMTGLARPVMID
jgi:hypothetical protein